MVERALAVKEETVKSYSCTCPVCRIEHVVRCAFLSSPRALRGKCGNVLPAHTCGAHTQEEVHAARFEV